MSPKHSPTVRSLYAWEILEARRVFADALDYHVVRISENTSFPNTINRLGAMLRRIPYVETPNAITLGNHCYFPLKLPESPLPPTDLEFYKLTWLMHELTHVWQYQHLGWRYLILALQAQFRLGEKAYDFGGEQGLLDGFTSGKKLTDYNPEQQGDIVRTYYERIARGEDVSAWLPFLVEVQQFV